MNWLTSLTPDQWTWLGCSIIFGILSFASGCYLGYTECKREMEVFLQDWLPDHWSKAANEEQK